ncbi:hypothetical protein Ddye_025426 [Dipteronia dyeriana]|uniref:N-acetyltransferase domain-containing protein n=1 Tax=Dipteronia dyeriana TaxID=168575 RepID=A0AAD9TKD2_9ROSI|nr:hypothetical protein Ddye_025426 [Dipteronia dyeriana]
MGRCRDDVWYAVVEEFWGQEVATKAVKIALGEVFKDFPEVVRLQAYVDVENKAKGCWRKLGNLGSFKRVY